MVKSAAAHAAPSEALESIPAKSANDHAGESGHRLAGTPVSRAHRLAAITAAMMIPSPSETNGQIGVDSAGCAALSSAWTPLPCAANANTKMADALTNIVQRKRAEVLAQRASVPLDALKERISELGRTRNFFQAVVDHGRQGHTRIIAEVKAKSPSAGTIRPDFDPVAIARQYHAAGASAISCLTDEASFGGRPEHIHAIRDAVRLPVLRKDFIIDEYQVWESRAIGADAILLIAECLTEREIIDFQILAVELGMTTLLEVHDAANLYRVVNHVGFPHPGYSLLGINNRNLRTMKTDITHSLRMADFVDDPTTLVSESGITTPADLSRLRDHGIHIALVGEHLLREADPGLALRALLA